MRCFGLLRDKCGKIREKEGHTQLATSPCVGFQSVHIGEAVRARSWHRHRDTEIEIK